MPPEIPRSIARAVRFARASAITLLVLGGLSTLVNVLHPLSVHFLISVVALGVGLAEWILAGQLARLDARAPVRLAWNQVVLGGGILAYGLHQARVMTPEVALAYLDRPLLRPLWEALPPEEIRIIHEMLPPMLRVAYYAVGIGGALGCGAVALYYRSRRRLIAATPSTVKP
jgi:hypothetical protein